MKNKVNIAIATALSASTLMISHSAYAWECVNPNEMVAAEKLASSARRDELQKHLLKLKDMKLSDVLCIFGKPHLVQILPKGKNYRFSYGNPDTDAASDDQAYEVVIAKDERVLEVHGYWPKEKKKLSFTYDLDTKQTEMFTGKYTLKIN